MKLALICFTKNGAALAKAIVEKFIVKKGYDYSIASTNEYTDFELVKDLREWTENAFSSADGIIFIGACGIAVRSIAPFLKSKTSDPAVLVIDDNGKFAIPILSGHIGGANDLAIDIAACFEAMTAVITTATDGQKLIAIDSFALKHNMIIRNMTMVKEISASLLEGKTVGLISQFSCYHIPAEFTNDTDVEIGVFIAVNDRVKIFDKTLLLIPHVLHLGIGCKKNTPFATIENFLLDSLKKKGIAIESISTVASIDLKADEESILALCNKYNWKFETYKAEELNKAIGHFTASKFVKKQTGVDNVCERAAILSAGEGSLLLQSKISKKGVTLAFALEEWSVDFAK